MSPGILHIISGLGVGGAEKNLQQIASALAADSSFAVDQHVVDLSGGENGLSSNDGIVAQGLRDAGIGVTSLGLGRRPLGGYWQLFKLARRLRPEIIHGWMYKGCFLAGLLRLGLATRRLWHRTTRSPTLIWSIRHSLQAWDAEPRRTRWLIRVLGSPLFRPLFRPWVVTFNSAAGRRSHAAYGYEHYHTLYLPNALNMAIFKVSGRNRRSFREAVGISETAPLVGFVGREQPLKNLNGFLDSAILLRRQLPEAQFVLVGSGLDRGNASLQAQLVSAGLSGCVHALGLQKEMHTVYNGLDLLISPSLSEGTANVIWEAAACGCACVATDVGDAALVLPANALMDVLPAASFAQRCTALALPLLRSADLREQQGAHSSSSLSRLLLGRDSAQQHAQLYRAAVARDSQALVALETISAEEAGL